MMSLPSHSDSPQVPTFCELYYTVHTIIIIKLLGEEVGENIFKFQKIKSVLLSSNLVSLAGYPY